MGFGTKKHASSASSAQVYPDGPIVAIILQEFDERNFQGNADALTDWLNARWQKSGYQVTAETVLAVLKCNNRDAARLGMDQLAGTFRR